MSYLLDHSDKFIPILVLVFIGIIFRVILQALGQRWVTTTAHTATITSLPIITYVITNVISGDIALSLGMVGALSIVRFRHPVRSPLELSVYFASITAGIAAAVGLKWVFFLVASLACLIFTLIFVNFLSVYLFKRQFLTSSFAEGNAMSTLEVVSKGTIHELETSVYLSTKQVSAQEVRYVLASNDFNALLALQHNFQGIENIFHYQISK